MPKMSTETLRQLLDAGVQQSTLWANEGVRGEQLRNLAMYLGYPHGNEKPGRSQVVSWDVFEIVESAMPGFIEPFFSGDDIGEFAPRTQQDEPFAAQATDYVNYLVKEDNDGFLLFNTWIKDALLSKIGIVRAEWVPVDPERVELEGIAPEQLAMLVQRPEIEIIEHTQRLDTAMPEALAIQLQAFVHDVTVLKRWPGKVQIENVKPENFVVSRGAPTIANSRIVGEIVTYTRSDLKEMGYRQAATVESFTSTNTLGVDGVQDVRQGEGAGLPALHDDDGDPSMEEVQLFRGFIRADFNGDGIAEWRQVLAGDGEDGILENEEAEAPDYCVITPIPIPHRIIGMAYADPAVEIAKIKTTLTRQYLDSLYLANRPRTYVNRQAKVDLNDLLADRIGGLVRGDGPATNAIQPLQTTIVSRDALEGLQMADGMRETRLGIPKLNPGLEADALHKTATGVRSVNALVDKRQLMTLRIMAETGIKDLFRLVLRLVVKHQDAPRTLQLRGQWVPFNPVDWPPDMNCKIAVGIGSGDKTETVMQLGQFWQFMQSVIPAGVVTPQNAYEFGLMLAKNAKLQGADTKLLTDPSKQPPKPPQPPEALIKAQAQQQVEAAKLQANGEIEQMRTQMQAQLERERMAMQQQTDIVRQQAEAEQHRMKVEGEAQLAQLRLQMDDARHAREMEHQRWKAELDASVRIQVANIGSQSKVIDPATQAATDEIAREVQP